MFTPPQIEPLAQNKDDSRIGHLLGSGLGEEDPASVVLIGFPSDQQNENAEESATTAIRRELYRLTPDPLKHKDFVSLLNKTKDLGDLRLSGDLAKDQKQLGEVVAEYLEKDIVPIILGGGHETALGHFLGYVKANRAVQILNWDAHLDVRDLEEEEQRCATTFRQVLLHPSGACSQHTVAGLQRHCVARQHLEFIAEHKSTAIFTDELNEKRIDTIYQETQSVCMATFDLDAVDQAYAPGVNESVIGGLDQRLWLHAAYWAGKCSHVSSMDLVELNPSNDSNRRTAKLAALTVWKFFQGLAERWTSLLDD